MDARRNDCSLSSFRASHAFPAKVASRVCCPASACLPAWKRPSAVRGNACRVKIIRKRKMGGEGKRNKNKEKHGAENKRQKNEEGRWKGENERVEKSGRERTRGSTRFEEERRREWWPKKRGNRGRRNGRTLSSRRKGRGNK